MHEVWKADDAVGKGDIWCVSCGLGHRIEYSVLVALLDPRAGGRWTAIPEGSLVLVDEEEG
jgi:hypothetical protein